MRSDVPAEDSSAASRIALACVVRAHGVRGTVRCRLYGDSADSLTTAGPVFLPDGRVSRVRILATSGRHALCQLDGVNDRTAATALVGSELAVSRDRLRAPDISSYFHVDLIGLRVRDTDDRAQGTVVAVHNFGAGDLLEIQPPAGASVFVPFTIEAVPGVDIAGGVLRADAAWFTSGAPPPSRPPTPESHHDGT